LKKLIVTEVLVTILQAVICGASFGLFLSIVSRIMFAGKVLGMRAKLGVMITFETLAVVSIFLLPLIFGIQLNIWKFLAFVLFCLISAGLMIYDDFTYIYDEEDI